MKQTNITMIKWFKDKKSWIVLFVLCLGIQLFQAESLFRFDRQLIEQGQIWRLLSGHLTHLNWIHYLLNMAGLGMVMIFFSGYQRDIYWLNAILFLSVICSAGLILDGELDRYVGLSGVLHGLFIIGGFWELKRYKVSGSIVLILMLGKLIWEQMYGALPASESMTGGKIALNSHLYGAMAGVLFLVLFKKTAK